MVPNCSRSVSVLVTNTVPVPLPVPVPEPYPHMLLVDTGPVLVIFLSFNFIIFIIRIYIKGVWSDHIWILPSK